MEVAARVSGLGTAEVGALSGRMVPLLALAVPFLLVTLVAGARRGLQAWPGALAAGVSFAAVQAVAGNLLGPQLVSSFGLGLVFNGLAFLLLMIVMFGYGRDQGIYAMVGRLVVAGYHQDGPRTVNMWLWNCRGIDVVNAHERDPRAQREGVLAAAGAVAAGRLDPGPLFTTYPLDRLGAAFQAMEERPDGFVKALVTP